MLQLIAVMNTDRSVIRCQRMLSDIALIERVCAADKESPFCSKCLSSVTPFTYYDFYYYYYYYYYIRLIFSFQDNLDKLETER